MDELCVRFNDAYPKARHHALVVARDPRLEGPADLRAQDVALLEHMQARPGSRSLGLIPLVLEVVKAALFEGGDGKC